MPGNSPNPVLRYIRKVAAAEHAPDLPDRELLRRFVSRGDGAAFAALVRRHGPMVLRLCRRVLRHEQDAEDAFQAAFLVLSRQAASLCPRESLSGWLYAVAYRVAQKAKVAAARRRRYEACAAGRADADPLAEITVREAHAILDRELARLPDRFRAPVVLCYLEGLTRDEAAQRLGWAPGTLKSRLEQARQRLRLRLAARGLALSGLLVASCFSAGAASGAVPPALLRWTARAATAAAAGGAEAPAVSPEVARLTEGMVQAMWLTRIKTVSALLLVGGCLAVGLGVLLGHAGQAAPAGAPQPGRRQADPARRPARGVAKPQTWRPLKVVQAEKRPDSLSFSPDAKLVAGVLNERDKKPNDAGSALCLWGVRTGEVKRVLDADAEFRAGDLWWFHAVRFSPDGKTLAASAGGFERVGKGARVAGAVRLFDVTTRKLKHTLEHDNQVWELAFSPDGKTVAGCSTGKTVPLWDVESGTLTRTLEVADTQVFALALSPDGKVVASGGSTYQGGDEAEIKLWDAATGKLLRVMAGKEHARSLSFSADGKLLAAGATSGVKVWEVKTGKLRHALGSGFARRAVFAPDGKTLAAGTEEGEVNVWDAGTGELRQTLKGHVGPVLALDFSRDGRTLATGGSDHSIRLWRLGQ